MNRRVVTLILGGGAGSRLYPLTRDRAKPAVPIGAAYRLIDIPLSNAINSGFLRVFVITQFNSESLNRHIARSYRFDHFSGGYVEILAASLSRGGDWYRGTADAVRQNLQHLDRLRFDHILILSGDHLYRMDYREFLATHLAEEADVTIAARMMERSMSSRYGVIEANRRRVTGFREKPGPSEVEHLGERIPISMGIYIFRRTALQKILLDSSGEDFGNDILPAMLADYRVAMHSFEGFWEDVGTIRSYYDANLMLAGPSPPFNLLDPSWPLYSRPRFLPVSRISDSNLDSVLVGEGGTVEGGTIRRSVIGLRSMIRRSCVIEDTLMLGHDYYDGEVDAPPGAPPLGIGSGTTIRGVILDKNVRVGDGCRITNESGAVSADGESHTIRDGIVIIPKNAVIPSGTVI